MLVQYFSVVIMGMIIALNVNSFMQNLLVTLKSLLRDMTLIKTNYDINILIFAFVNPQVNLLFPIGHGHILPPDYPSTEHEPRSGGPGGLQRHARSPELGLDALDEGRLHSDSLFAECSDDCLQQLGAPDD